VQICPTNRDFKSKDRSETRFTPPYLSAHDKHEEYGNAKHHE